MGCGKAFSFYKEYLQMLTWQSGGEKIERQVGKRKNLSQFIWQRRKIDHDMQTAPHKLGGIIAGC